MSLSILVAAGGTGGHMVPANALASELQRRGHRVTLLTDERGLRFPGLFDGVERVVVESASLALRNPFAALRALFRIARGRRRALAVARKTGAQAVVGFGGHPALPGLLAGTTLRLVTILHEQNAVLGRVNRGLQGGVTALALSYAETAGLSAAGKRKAQFTGNPVRAAILAGRKAAFQPPRPGQPFHLLVVGGSQGARILSRLLPPAIEQLPDEARRRLRIVQQCRAEDLSAVASHYQKLGVDALCTPYFADLPEKLRGAHLMVSRAGASTLAELTAMGRPAILVPFAAATDDHQTANARAFVEQGAGLLLPEAESSPARLAGMLQGFIESPESLRRAAAAARGLGVPDAVARLADLVEEKVAK